MRNGGAQHIARPTQWRVGNPPPWQHRDVSVLRDHNEVHARLVRHIELPIVYEAELTQVWVKNARPAAVLIALLTENEAPSVLLTRRADHLRNHKGEISFPGGRMELNETPHQTALREAREEVALSSDAVSVIGTLNPLTTFVSNSLITPVVARVAGSPSLQADPGEVARIFTVALYDLVRQDTYHNEIWTTDRGDLSIHFFALDDETIWGATARMLHQLLDVVTAG